MILVHYDVSQPREPGPTKESKILRERIHHICALECEEKTTDMAHLQRWIPRLSASKWTALVNVLNISVAWSLEILMAKLASTFENIRLPIHHIINESSSIHYVSCYRSGINTSSHLAYRWECPTRRHRNLLVEVSKHTFCLPDLWDFWSTQSSVASSSRNDSVVEYWARKSEPLSSHRIFTWCVQHAMINTWMIVKMLSACCTYFQFSFEFSLISIYSIPRLEAKIESPWRGTCEVDSWHR